MWDLPAVWTELSLLIVEWFLSSIEGELASAAMSAAAAIDHQRVYDSWLLNYCFCGGVGLGPIDSLLIYDDMKCCCSHNLYSCSPIVGEDGLCAMYQSACCCSGHCSIGPLEGAPKCVCLKKVPPQDIKIKYKDQFFDYQAIFEDTFWLYYCCCVGTGCHGINTPSRGYCASSQKMLCVRQIAKCEGCTTEEGALCEAVGVNFCCYNDCSFPCRAGNPGFVCCNMCRKEAPKNAHGADVVGKTMA